MAPRFRNRPREETGDEQRIRRAVAAILLEAAHADEDYAPLEEARIRGALERLFGLGSAEIDDIIARADRERSRSIDMWPFARTINEEFSEEEKERIIEGVWEVVYADGRLDQYEDYLVHKLSRVMHIPHHVMIRAKLRVTQRDE
jgi:uncharacterized tellurite resistance protein B-like protein